MTMFVDLLNESQEIAGIVADDPKNYRLNLTSAQSIVWRQRPLSIATLARLGEVLP